MKQSIRLSLYFYLFIVMFFTQTIACDQIYKEIPLQIQDQKNDQQLLDIYTTLRIIKKIHKDLEDYSSDALPLEDQTFQEDCMIEIIAILVGTYEKIVGATVTYYLMINMPGQQNIQHTIAIIIAQDAIKILNILSKRLLSCIYSQKMTWQQKAWHCTWVVGVIILIKLGIDQIPQPYKSDKSDKKENIPLQVSVQNSDSHKIQEAESGFLQGKFNNW